MGRQPTDLFRGEGQDPRPPWAPAFEAVEKLNEARKEKLQ
jgi:hypothetical protein